MLELGRRQGIAANLDLLFPASPPTEAHTFRVTRGAEGDSTSVADATDADEEPGSILKIVTRELKARRFAGVVRLQVNAAMPDTLCDWLCQRLEIGPEDVHHTSTFMALSDLMKVPFQGHPELRYPPHEPATHPRVVDLPAGTGSLL